MAANRAIGRNVHLYDAKDRIQPIGGLLLTNGITKENFLRMVEIFILETSFVQQDKEGSEVQDDNDPLQPGNYYIIGESPALSYFNIC